MAEASTLTHATNMWGSLSSPPARNKQATSRKSRMRLSHILGGWGRGCPSELESVPANKLLAKMFPRKCKECLEMLPEAGFLRKKKIY